MTDLITKKPLYTKIDITDMSKKEILDIIFYKNPIDCFCPYCENPSIFLKIPDFELAIREKTMAENPLSPYVEGKLFDKPETFQLNFACSRNDNHILNVIYKVENETITKIGQSPSLFDIQKNDFKKYRKILGNNYSDFSKAIMFYTSNYGVAAFTHIRRILENFFVKKAYEIKKVQIDWNDKEYKDLRFQGKLEVLRDLLPPTLINNARLYSIVSKGIHELEEDECLLAFEAVKECIMLSLNDIIKEENDNKSQKKIKSALSRIENKINNK